jgi:hypothetical protein
MRHQRNDRLDTPRAQTFSELLPKSRDTIEPTNRPDSGCKHADGMQFQARPHEIVEQLILVRKRKYHVELGHVLDRFGKRESKSAHRAALSPIEEHDAAARCRIEHQLNAGAGRCPNWRVAIGHCCNQVVVGFDAEATNGVLACPMSKLRPQTRIIAQRF